MKVKDAYKTKDYIKDGVKIVIDRFNNEEGATTFASIGIEYGHDEATKELFLGTCDFDDNNIRCVYNKEYVIFYKVDNKTDKFLGVKKIFDIDNCLNIEFDFDCLTEKGQEIVDQKTGYTKIKRV